MPHPSTPPILQPPLRYGFLEEMNDQWNVELFFRCVGTMIEPEFSLIERLPMVRSARSEPAPIAGGLEGIQNLSDLKIGVFNGFGITLSIKIRIGDLPNSGRPECAADSLYSDPIQP